MLYLEGPLGAGKTSRLLAETSRLLQDVPASSVLVLCSNHTRQHRFTKKLLKAVNAPLAQVPVYTYAGFVRNALFNYWPLVESEIAGALKKGRPQIRPELSGMQDTELMLSWLLARLRIQAHGEGRQVFADFPGTDAHIIKQVVRRLRLRSENQLSRKEMQERSVLLNETCREETAWLEQQFDVASYALRVLDANKQLDIFHGLLKKENAFSGWLKNDIGHLIVDDVDETIPAQQEFVRFLAPSVESLILAADIDGGSRRGYLNAYPYDWEAMKRLRPGETVRLTRNDTAYASAQTLLSNWKQVSAFKPLPQDLLQVHDRFITRVEMLEQVVEDIQSMLEAGRSPGDFCLVLPKTDFLSFYQLQNRLNQRGIPVQLLSGTRRPSDNPRCKAFLYLLQWANTVAWQAALSPWEIKTVLMQALQLHHVPEVSGEPLEQLTQAVAEAVRTRPEQGLPPAELLPLTLPDEAVARYRLLGDWLVKSQGLSFDKQLYSAFTEVLAGFSGEQDAYGDLNRIIQSYLRQKTIHDGFRADGFVQEHDFDRWWLQQAKNGTVADTPEIPEAVRPDALVIGTPQKVIDNELYRKIQIWLDVGTREWARSDNAPLYNAWVHSAVWDRSTAAFTEEFNEAVIRTRAGHITRTLMLLATEKVHAYASELDDLGFTQTGLLKPRLLTEAAPQPDEAALQRAVLRPDQAPILEYRQGAMAISAVPGAGKTFVNVELLLELIERGVEPDRILVLTYMDSAAKTLLARLKQKLSSLTRKLPVVSTIHSLAFRILTENDHSLLAGFLPDDMTILDDYGRGEVLNRVAAATLPESARNVNDWLRGIDRGINHAKMFGITVDELETQLQMMPDNFRLREFLPAYKAYNLELHRNGFLDFTDLIVKAADLLRNYPDLREKYRNQFEYIIEDEAQDSSRMLQDFIGLLGGDNPNLIRTGDTNQSITTTFSSADTSVFREFIRQAEKTVHMNHSGRCATEIIDLANFWMEEAGKSAGLEQAFEPVKMLAVKGKNPTLLFAPHAALFDLDRMEEDWLTERIRAIRAEQPDASIAVLVRSNSQVNRITGLLHLARIPAISLSEQLNLSPVFTLIAIYLKWLAEPGNLGLQKRWYQLMVEMHLVPDRETRKTFLDTTCLLYQTAADLDDELLRQWYYDGLDFSRQAAGGNICALIMRMTDRLFASVSDRSNGYLCALMAQDILSSYQHLGHLSPLEIVIHQFDSFQNSWRGKKSFTEVLNQHAGAVIQVMSIHKAKGQEFDVVFMPFLQADSFPHEAEKIRFDEADKLIQELDRMRRVSEGWGPKAYEDTKKREKIEEEARLIYVGLTRARRALYLSAHKQAMTKFHKLRNTEPSLAFQVLSGEISAKGQTASNIIPFREQRHVQ